MLFGLNGKTEVQAGDKAPDFTLPDHAGNRIHLAECWPKAPVVLFFYPKDDTPGCRAEACSFRDSYQAFVDLGAQVFGISSDPVVSHQQFASKHSLPFPLLSDEKSEVRRLYGVPNTLGVLPGRVTYVIDTNGIIRSRIVAQFDPARHIAKSLESLRHIINGDPAPVDPVSRLINPKPQEALSH